MNYHDLTAYIQDGMLNEEGAAPAADSATTMDAISYLPTQVGAVQFAMKKLKKKKNKWNLEIQESDDNITVNFENQLKIDVPREHWDNFQEIFDGTLDEDTYLDLQSKLKDSIYLDSKGILESRKDELKSKIVEELNSKEIQTAMKVAEKWVSMFGCKENITPTTQAIIPLQSVQEWLEGYLGNIIEEYGEDLGHLEMMIEKFQTKGLGEGKCLAGARYQSEYGRTSLIFEARVSFEKDCSFSIAIEDGKVADCLEEACNGLQRVGNVFYPRYGQLISSDGVLEELKEVIDDMGEQNET